MVRAAELEEEKVLPPVVNGRIEPVVNAPPLISPKRLPWDAWAPGVIVADVGETGGTKFEAGASGIAMSSAPKLKSEDGAAT